MGVLALALSGADTSVDEGGHLQVKAGVGVMIEVGPRHAVVQDEYGVAFTNLEPGAYALVARRGGFVTQHALVRIRSGEVTVHRLAPWQKHISGRGRGAIVVQTLPVEATVAAHTLGYDKAHKGDEDFIIPRVPDGTHRLTFCTDYKCIDYRVTIEGDALVKLFVDFDEGEVVDLSHNFRAHLAELAQVCLRTRDDAACTESCTLATRLEVPSPTCRITQGSYDLDVADREKPDTTAIPASTRRALP